MNYNEAVSNKEQNIKVNLDVSDITEVKSFAGEPNADIQVQDTKISFDISELPSIEQLEFGENVNVEDICDADNRTKVANTSVYPWRAICRLIITRDDGRVAVGSGWLNGKGTVITAGHCVFSNELKKWHKSIIVIPGKNHTSEPYGNITSSNFHSVKGWTEQLNSEYDYGSIILTNKIGERTGYFGFRYDPDSEIKNKPIINSGYPADKSGDQTDTQWFTKGGIENLNPRKVYYKLDTFGGNSGSPVWIDDSNNQAICIHAYGGCPNSGTRINKEVFNNLLNWRNIGESITEEAELVKS